MELTVSASESSDRIPNLFDGDRDTRWIAGTYRMVRAGCVHYSERPADVARVELQIADRSIGDYPRLLRIEGEDGAGRSHPLYEASPHPELAGRSSHDGRHPNLIIPIPHNGDTIALWIRQTAPSLRSSWSIHELRVWRYDSSGGNR